MAPRKMSKSNPVLEAPATPPRPRVICPGCSTELTIHKMLSTTEAFVYASKTDMKALGIECTNDSCPLYIEGIENVDEKLLVNPMVEKCVEAAKKERAAIDAAKKEKKAEDKKAKYASYDPFSGAKEKAAEEAMHRAKSQKDETEKISKNWEKVQKTAAKLKELESEGPSSEQ